MICVCVCVCRAVLLILLWQLLLPVFHSQNNNIQPQPTLRSVLTSHISSSPLSSCSSRTLKKFQKHPFSPNIVQILSNQTDNLLSGHCHLVLHDISLHLDKLTLIFLNQGICQLCVIVLHPSELRVRAKRTNY